MQQNQTKVYIAWALRILIAGLFIFSAYAKMYKLWAFEKQLVDLGIATWCQSHYWARGIIGLEAAIGLALLQNNYIRSLVIPGTILLLVLFNIHLSIEMVKHGAMNGNCGCFGELIKMTPLEAFIKNLITIGLLVYLFFLVRDREKGQNRIIYPLALFFACLSFMFIVYPFCPCGAKESNLVMVDEPITTTSTDIPIDTLSTSDSILALSPEQTAKTPNAKLNDTIKSGTTQKGKPSAPSETAGVKTDPKKSGTTVVQSAPAVRSRFAQFTKFGNTTANLDEGRKIVCMFAPGCDHCRATAKALAAMSSDPNFPQLYILFMDEETFKIPDFFQETKANFPYVVLDIPTFWETMGPDASTPGVYYLENGKIMKSYQGIEKQEFKAEEFKSVIGVR